jgi:hypothetical protein
MSPQQYREKSEVLRAEYCRRLDEWREKVDPLVLDEMNRRRVAKGKKRISRGVRRRGVRPINGYLRYVPKSTHFAVTVLSKVSAIFSTYDMRTQGERKIMQPISGQ